MTPRQHRIPTRRSPCVAFWLIALFCLLAFLVGCGESKPEAIGRDSTDVSVGGASAIVRDVTTPGGVRCVILVGSGRGGISCDWDHTPSTIERK